MVVRQGVTGHDADGLPRDEDRRRIRLAIGWGLTGLWIAFVLVQTRADPSQPLFDLIFTVPLAGWITTLVVLRLRRWFVRRRLGTADKA